MAYRYSVLGIRIDSYDPIPGAGTPVRVPEADIAGATAGDAADDTVALQVFLDRPPPAAMGAWQPFADSDALAEDGRPAERITIDRTAQYYRIAYADGTLFWLDPPGQRCWCRWPEPLTVEDAAIYLLGPVLGFYLRLRGWALLHASAVVIDGQAVACAGPAGAGKSTTAAAFARMGYRVLSDDIVVLHPCGERIQVFSDSPLLRLWPRSSELLFGSAEALPPLTPNWDKRGLDLASEQHEASPRPLAAIYLLDGVDVDQALPIVRSVPQQQAMIALLGHGYRGRLAERLDPQAELDRLAEVVRRVPVRRVHRPPNAHPPAAICQVILEDLRQVSRAVSAAATHV